MAPKKKATKTPIVKAAKKSAASKKVTSAKKVAKAAKKGSKAEGPKTAPVASASVAEVVVGYFLCIDKNTGYIACITCSYVSVEVPRS